MTVLEVIIIIVIHWIADFVLQTDKESKGKSKNWSDLLSHTLNYTSLWYYIGIFYIAYRSNFFIDMKWYNDWSLTLFVIITFISHTITDYFTSRLNTKLLPKRDLTYTHIDKQLVYFPKGENYHNFFVSVGFDQVLHYLQLFLTYYWLVKM